LKATELFSKAILLPTVCLWRLHGGVFNFIHLSAMGLAEIDKGLLKGCPHIFTYIEYVLYCLQMFFKINIHIGSHLVKATGLKMNECNNQCH
jgi:hypothetical protein